MFFRRRLAADTRALGPHSTEIQETKVVQRSNVLRQKILSWQKLQLLYTPFAHVVRARSSRNTPSGSPEEPTHSIPRLLPSEIGKYGSCDRKLYEYEWQLRCAQASDALEEVRNHLRLRSHLFHNKDRNETGQRALTRTQGLLASVLEKVNSAADAYRSARSALESLASLLGKGTGWQYDFKELRAEDLRSISVGALGDSEGTRTMSWIWVTYGVSAAASNGSELHNCGLYKNVFVDLF